MSSYQTDSFVLYISLNWTRKKNKILYMMEYKNESKIIFKVYFSHLQLCQWCIHNISLVFSNKQKPSSSIFKTLDTLDNIAIKSCELQEYRCILTFHSNITMTTFPIDISYVAIALNSSSSKSTSCVLLHSNLISPKAVICLCFRFRIIYKCPQYFFSIACFTVSSNL